MFKKIVVTVGKLILCALAFYVGFILGGIFSAAAGFPTPEMPAGAVAATVQTALMISGFPVAICLALLSSRISLKFTPRWLSLAALVWLAYGVNTYLEANIFTTYGSASLINVITSLGAGLLGGAAVAWFFPPAYQPEPLWITVATFFRRYRSSDCAWRFLAAIVAFPVIYYFFGWLISPIVVPYYQQQGGSLVIPSLGILLPVLFFRSSIFLVSCFMVLVAWRSTRFSLALSLGAAMFMLVGGIGLMVASFLPAILRVVHSFEILADSLCYAIALSLLFRPGGKVNVKRAEVPVANPGAAH
jgi:hypothetical protein